jgi:hypothetical protein
MQLGIHYIILSLFKFAFISIKTNNFRGTYNENHKKLVIKQYIKHRCHRKKYTIYNIQYTIYNIQYTIYNHKILKINNS